MDAQQKKKKEKKNVGQPLFIYIICIKFCMKTDDKRNTINLSK